MKLTKTLILCMAGAVLCISLTGCGDKAQSEQNSGAPTGTTMGGPPPGGPAGGPTGMPTGAPKAPK